MRHRAAAGPVAIVAAGLVAVAAGPQQPAPAQAPAQVFQATTVVIEVDAIVTGGDGRFVGDLSADDFEVLEQDAPQTIQAVYLIDGRSVSPVPAAPSATAPAGSRPVAPAPAAAPQRVFILVFDQDHLAQGAFRRLQSAAEEFLTTEFQTGDMGGVLIGGTMAGNRLTGNREELVAAVKSVKLSPDATLRMRDLQDWPRMSETEAIRIAVAFDNTVLNQVADRAAREGPQGRGAGMADLTPTVMEKARVIVSGLRQAAIRALGTLTALTAGLGRIPGRKTVVLLSEGFYVEEAQASLRQIVASAARSNVRIYSLDARGLDRRRDGSDLSVMNPMETGASLSTAAYDRIEDGPNTLAVDTGGYVIRNTNAFGDALGEIARDTSRYYVIGYSPSNATMDGAFREITVKVNRPGVTVRARKGYVASPESMRTVPVRPPAAAPTPAPAGTPPAPADVAPLPPPTTPTPEPPADIERALVPPIAPAIALRPDTETRVGALAAREGDAGEARTLASEGWDLYGRGDLEGAARTLGQAAGLPGAAPWVFYALGFAQLGLGQPREAAQTWEQVRRAVPEFEAVYLDLADAYLQQSDPGQAIRVLRAAEARWPADAEVLNALGTVQVHREALSDAIETFQKAIDVQPEQALAYFNLARTYELRYYKMRRFSRPGARWMDNPADARKALENYQAYLAIGGSSDAEAKAAVERLQWVVAIK